MSYCPVARGEPVFYKAVEYEPFVFW